ncbi:LPS export ABC transporter ATP-binding protein [Ectothiorhodospira mobilis]|uniref:Lipopolysaccharide export system ATP-binding protein LptB n=1 Tax=Ectothiorhodospira mobilis TaxID=195064 RepID=A0A1I4R9F8_ECTMO|nr:LPS export ABC transporter ATP-binding protein [Ectothiorhodospira mobilis]MCG5534560.1 LPS export ABC transporter ATP-binding protein [Ectothiorhodospira mobilis]SFM48934.1 lipopolysaccharide export system ATP-binding protein [Ectothiorhodospira mobilis]
MSRLEALDLVKRYRSRRPVDGTALAVESGEVVGLLGPNGAGKTTCFYMIVGLVPCDEGRILLDGRDITRLPMHARARLGLGYLPQEPSVFRKLSVAENILAVLEVRGDLDRAQRQDHLENLLEEFQIAHIRDNPGISLSGGERRRVEIARALATEPAFILLDEPFAGVDPISVIEIQRIIAHLTARGIGVLITDHNVRETLGICTRAYILSDGRVISRGSPEEVLSDPQVRRVYLGEHFRL